MGRMKNKIVVIIGASGGMGTEITKRFADEGAILVLSDIRDEIGMGVADDICKNGGEVCYYHADATEESEIKKLFDKIRSKYDQIDAAVNALGIGQGCLIEDTSAELFDRIMKTNVYSLFYAMKEERSLMNKGGVIVNISSINSTVANPYHATYCTSKAACDMLSRVAAMEWGPDGIRVCTLNPGLVKTDLTKKFWADEEILEDFLFKVPLRRIATVEDVANGVLFLCSDEASYITASSLLVDGGMTPEGYPDAQYIMFGAPVPRGECLKSRNK